MTLQSEIGTAPLIEPPPDKTRRKLILTLGIGILIGILFGVIVTVALFNFGFFDQFYVCPAQTSIEACPPDDVLAPPCPTCMPALTAEPKIIVVTSTPDIGATATAACSTFETQFRGTPCPDTSNP